MTTFSTKIRRVLARQTRTVFTLASISTFAFVALVYLVHNDANTFLSESWDYEAVQQWDWRKLAPEWRTPTLPEITMEDPFDYEEPPHVWNNTCQKAVDKELKVALYDWTPFHEGERLL